MSTYFSQIAARNNPSGTSSIIPAKSPVVTTDPNPFQQDIGESSIDSVQKFLPDDRLPGPHQSVKPSEPLQPERKIRNSEPNPSNPTHHTRYFARHIERMELPQTKNEAETKIISPAHGLISAHTKTDFVSNKTVEANPSASKMNIRDKEVVKHPEQDPPDKTKTSLLKPTTVKKLSLNRGVVSSSVTKLQPAPALLSPSTPIQRTPVSKLVIGKITVEVIQPAKTSPPRIINRVIEAPSKTGTTSSNKLSFGLGQL